ncbi:hypothetical protein [Streptomyces cyaneofuscatus]|uniref:hypothetical protein n=1 Tax=Streptomyces cyaneofuscatus TaxID=66883 RepID=UPI0033A3192C
MNRSRRVRVLLPLLTAVTALSLSACAGAEPDPAKGGVAEPIGRATPTATSSSPPTPSPSPSPTTSPTTAAEIAEAVDQWYVYGGETAMVSLIKEAVKAQAGRPQEELQMVVVDFGGLMEALSTARVFHSLPDPKTRTAWAAAIEHLDEGAREVLGSVPQDRMIQSPRETAQALHGWHTYDKGIKSLKTAQARLDRTFGLKPSPDPWEAT